jgi:hypothetical protein
MVEQNRSREPRVLEYRKHLKTGIYLVFAAFVFSSGLCLGDLVQWVREAPSGTHSAELLHSLLVKLFFSVLFGLQYFVNLRPLAAFQVQVFEDYLQIRRGQAEVRVDFDRVTSVQCDANPSLGGWFGLVMKDGQKHDFSMVLERAEKILDGVIRFNPLLMERERYLKLRTQLILADHGMARFYGHFKGRAAWVTLSHLFVVPIGFAAILGFKQMHQMSVPNPVSFWVMTLRMVYFPVLILGGCFLWWMNRTIDRSIEERLSREPENKLRDITFEEKTVQRLLPYHLGGLIAAFAVIYAFDLNSFSWLTPAADLPHLNLHQRETVWLDHRFNCVKCAHSLKRGDAIVFGNKGNRTFGRLVRLPGEMSQVNGVAPAGGRSPASFERLRVPEGKVAIQLNPDGGDVVLIDLSEVKGRLTGTFFGFLFPEDSPI